MDIAFAEARAAAAADEVPVGCAIVRAGEVIARAGFRKDNVHERRLCQRSFPPENFAKIGRASCRERV